MSIEKRTGTRGTRYKVRYRGPNGQERSRTFRTRKEAEAYERDQMRRVHVGDWADPIAARITLADWADEWLGSIVHLSSKTQETYADAMRLHVLPDVIAVDGCVIFEGLGTMPLAKITKGHVIDWVKAMTRKRRHGANRATVSASTAHQAYRVLRVCLNAAVDKERLMRNPAAGVKPPRVETKPMRFLTEQQVSALAGAIDERYRALVMIGCLCGLRAGEMLALRWENVDMLGRKIQVIEQTDETAGLGATKETKTRKNRAVTMPRAVVDALAVHAARQAAGWPADDDTAENVGIVGTGENVGTVSRAGSAGTVGAPRLRVVGDTASSTGPEGSEGAGDAICGTGLVFTAPEGGPVDLHHFRTREWHPAVKAAGIAPGLRVHDMRHTAASLAIKAGADIKVVQAMLGHASAAMTLDRYGHLMPGQAEAVADRLDRLMEAAAG